MGNSRRLVEDMSGHCRHNGYEGAHARCAGSWETPSALVTCVCVCHEPRKVLVPKGQRAAEPETRVLVPKK